MFTPDDALADAMFAQGRQSADPVWRMPLWAPYDSMLDSRVADLNNVASGPFAGAVVAALFLQRFVTRAKHWAHFDVYAWTPSPKPGRPEGGEIQTARMLFDMLRTRYPAREGTGKRKAARAGRQKDDAQTSDMSAFDRRLTPARADLAAGTSCTARSRRRVMSSVRGCR